MKYGIISDVHSNLEALLSVKESIEREDVNEIIFLGDAVGYGASPNEAVELLTSWAQVFIAGNHDMAAVGATDISYFNPYARQAILWTARQLTRAHEVFLKSLPYSIKRGDYTFVHASPKEPDQWHYILSEEEAYQNTLYLETDICFIGHSHAPVTFIIDNKRVTVTMAKRLKIEEGKQYIINVGSVGQPRDGNPMAAYTLLDTETGMVEMRRVPYEIALAQQRMRKEHLPYYLIERLAWGH